MTDKKAKTNPPHAVALDDGELEQVKGGTITSTATGTGGSYYEGTVATGGYYEGTVATGGYYEGTVATGGIAPKPKPKPTAR